MKIEYTNSLADIEAYGQLIYAKSPTVKQHRKKAWLIAVVLIVIFGIVLYLLDNSTEILYFWLFLSVVWLIYIPFQHKRRYLKNMMKTYEDEEHKYFFGRHSLTIDDNGVTDEIGVGINHTEWEKIEHIEFTATHTFIFVDSSMAHAICKDAVIDGDYDTFVNNLKSKYNKHKKESDENENRSAE